LALAGIFLWRYSENAMNTWAAIGLVAAVICYQLLGVPFVRQHRVILLIAVAGATAIPVIFFLLTKAIFDDHFKPSVKIAFWLVLQYATHVWAFTQCIIILPGWAKQSSFVISQIVSLGFVLAGILVAIKTRKGDLVESRMKFRNAFTLITATLIGITLIVESMPVIRESTDLLQILQRSSILALTTFFLLNNFHIKSGFFFQTPGKEEEAVQVQTQDSELGKKLDVLINDKKVYRNEGLTIGQLAEMLNEHEYKVRRHINGELGFRNFNDFLNKYRVTEACQILRDPAQNRRTVLEIAYALGYQSVGPFNKAFKDFTQTTPTAYRKASKN